MTALKRHLARPNDIERGMCGAQLNGLLTSDLTKVTCARCLKAVETNKAWYKAATDWSDIELDFAGVNIRVKKLSNTAITLVMSSHTPQGQQEETVYNISAKEAVLFARALTSKAAYV